MTDFTTASSTGGLSGNPSAAGVSWRSWLVATVVGLGLSLVFWWSLYSGGGLLGGDIYTYFFPQKAYLAEHAVRGELPLWNNRVGHGYPVVGESQTGLFYPFHLLYAVLSVNAAYNTVQLVHYVLAFVFTWRYARQMGLGDVSGWLVGLVYVYGWFPPRIVLEWAILGGTWLPAVLWVTERFLARPRCKDLLLLSLVLALQMLAGHFHLAFVTQLVLVFYIPSRLWWAGRGLPEWSVSARRRLLVASVVGMGLAFGLAAVQLLPTWELKQSSQRENVTGRKYDPGYGHMPFAYWSQVVTPWRWYESGVDRVSQYDAGPAETNQVEAHLYFGLPTVGLLVVGLVGWCVGRRTDSRFVIWLVLGSLALLYTPAWHLPVTRHLPGFGFFTGPGRYGIVTALAAAMLAGLAWQWLMTRPVLARRGGLGVLLAVVVFPLLTWDLWEVGRKQTYAVLLETPLINRLEHSPVAARLQRLDGPVRLFCDYQNLPTLLRVASTPVYLGLGPAEYFDESLAMPGELPFGVRATSEQVAWLQRAGVTHLLTRRPLDTADWPVTLIESFASDPFLQVAYQGGDQRLNFFLYRLDGSRGRLSWLKAADGLSAEITGYTANQVTATVESTRGGRLVLTDLAYPGWSVRVDGEAVESVRVEGMYRGVDVPPGSHEVTWDYRPTSVIVGAVLSGVSLALLVGACLVGRRRFELAWDES
ncbi:MAG: YfhO family protein [Planctomycetota bacterium]|nr:YfhO family protein [Planctomycetota bacterium]